MHFGSFPGFSRQTFYSSRFEHKVFISTGTCLGSWDSQPQWVKHLEPMTSHFRTTSGASEDVLGGHKQNKNEFRAVTGTHNWSPKCAQYVCTEQKVPLAAFCAVTINNAL